MTSSASTVAELDSLFQRIARESNEKKRRQLLRKNPSLHTAAAVEHLYDEVARRTQTDLVEAEHLANATAWLAAQMGDDVSRAFGLRATGHILYLRRKLARAVRCYEQALSLFQRAGREVDAGRTLNGALQALIYLGQYDRAFAWAKRARTIFEKHGDHLRIARLNTNLGNVLFRQDRFEEALDYYRRAEKSLRRLGKPQDVAAVLTNIAVCYNSLNDAPRAFNAYQEARNYAQVHNLPMIAALTNYNVAYLHYIRGEYTRAIELYEATRPLFDSLQDPYHSALCDLDQAEMYLELNLSEEGNELAQKAFLSFERLQMGYEAAKALAFRAIALSHQGQIDEAVENFRDARRRFVREKNHVWPALIDLYQALVLFQAEEFRRSRRLCEVALRFFSKTSLTSKTVLCQLLLARLRLQAGRATDARRLCLAAIKIVERVEAPTLRYQAFFVLGQIEEALGRLAKARSAYERTHAGLEGLRSHLSGEELKISFLKDKLAVYESLVALSISVERKDRDPEAAFAYIEYAKSRSLADLIAFRANALPGQSESEGRMVGKVKDLRERLSWCYRQIEEKETGTEPASEQALAPLRKESQKLESELVRALGELRLKNRDLGALQNAGTVPLEQIQGVILEDEQLIEYYVARGILYAVIVARESLDVVPLGGAHQARNLLRLLHFQLSKFRFGADYARSGAALLLEATRDHLERLYESLLAPIQKKIVKKRLVIVPHDFLHYLPFHALFDGQSHLVDTHAVSYAPSASVYYLCCLKSDRATNGSLVLGVPDPLVPYISDEVRAVAEVLPESRLFIGEEANEEQLRNYGPTSRYVHIATHGFFRSDNPMFSSLRLGRSQLTLFDLYNLRLPAELVTLSGCGTGLNVVVGGDELLGLVRGLLYAGARSLLVTLWDVSDRSTADFMKLFYKHLGTTADKAVAVQMAMRDLRQSYPHPYFWAPFSLVGQSSRGDA